MGDKELKKIRSGNILFKEHFKLKISFDKKVYVFTYNTENNFCVKTVLTSRHLNMKIKNHGRTKSFYNCINKKLTRYLNGKICVFKQYIFVFTFKILLTDKLTLKELQIKY